MHPLIVVAGPTGSGKSSLALDIAVQFNGEIISCDSVQVYRGFDIGAAKLPLVQRRGIKHHLLDCTGPDVEFTAGDYMRHARAALHDVASRGKVPVVCGGTGFYLRALLWGLSPAPLRDTDLRLRLTKIAQRRPVSLHRLLARFDPSAAERIHPRDGQKLIRAIEIAHVEQSSLSHVQARPRNPLIGYAVLKIGLNPNRSELYDTLNCRASAMFASGLIPETEKLLQIGYKRDSKPLQSLGYRQTLQLLDGDLSLDQAITECQAKTRQYAKRQLTWFRADKEMNWLSGFGSNSECRRAALSLVSCHLQALPS